MNIKLRNVNTLEQMKSGGLYAKRFNEDYPERMGKQEAVAYRDDNGTFLVYRTKTMISVIFESNEEYEKRTGCVTEGRV